MFPNSHSQDEVTKAKNALPQTLQEFLDSDELKNAYLEIQKSLNLNLRQAGAIMEAVVYTLAGLEPETELEAVLKSRMPELPGETIAKVLESINEKIFSPARERVKVSRT